MQEADAVPLVDPEEAVVVAIVDAVAHVVGEGGEGGGELQDVGAVRQVADVQVEVERVVHVNAGQAHRLTVRQLVVSLLQCFVGAAALASFLRKSVDLALVTGLRRQRVLIVLGLRNRGPSRQAQTRNTVSLSRSVVSGGTAAEVAPICVGAAELAGVSGGGALVDVGAAARPLLIVEPSGAEAAETPQGVVARSPPADLGVQALVLIYALVPLVMLEVSLRAAAAISTHQVLTAVLASVAPITLIHIFTALSVGVQGEPALAVTVEAAGSVLADAV